MTVWTARAVMQSKPERSGRVNRLRRLRGGKGSSRSPCFECDYNIIVIMVPGTTSTISDCRGWTAAG